MPDGLADIKDLLDNSPRTRVHRIAEEEGIDPSLADDFLKVTGGIESGNRHYKSKGKVLRSPAGAWGFGQVMPDQKGGTTRTINGRKFNLLDEDDNIRAGLTYFSQGGSDPVARRLGYLAGHHSRAVKNYKSTGKIPKGGDPYTGVSFDQYVRASGSSPKYQQGGADIVVRSSHGPIQDAAQGLEDLLEKLPDIGDLLGGGQETPPPAPKPRSRRSLAQKVRAGVGGGTEARSNLPDVGQIMTETLAARRGPSRPIPQSPFAGVKAGAGPVAQPTGVGGLRQLDEPEVARITRIQKQVAAESKQSGLERGGGSEAQGLAQRYRQLPTTQHTEVLRRVSEERENESRRAELLQQLTPEDRATIRQMTERWAGLDPVSRGIETGSQRVGSGLLYKIAGLTDVLGGRENNVLGNYLRVQAGRGELTIEEIQNEIPPEAAEQAAEFLTQAIGTLPEIYAANAALGPVGGFAALHGVETLGRGEEAPAIASETAKGAILGKVFKGAGAAEIPIRPGMNRLGQRLANIARSSVPIAAGTAGTELAFGATPQEAAVSAASNVLFHVGGRLPKELPVARENIANRMSARQLAGEGHEVISQPGERPKIRLRTQGIERPTEVTEEGTPPDVLNEIVSDVRARLAQPSTRQRKARQPGKDRPVAQPTEIRPATPQAGVASTAPVAATTPQPSRIVREGRKFTVITPTRSGEMRTTVSSRAKAEGIAERADAANQQPVPAAKIPFLITRDMRSRLQALGYADSVINKMKPARAHEILEVERPPHHSDMQNRRERNVKTGIKGRFKKGKIEELPVEQGVKALPEFTARLRKYYSERLDDPSLLDKAVELPDGQVAVPVGGKRRYGTLSEKPNNITETLNLLRDRPGFPNVRVEGGQVVWGEKLPKPIREYSDAERGRQFGYSDKAIAEFEAKQEQPTAINIITGKKVKPKKGEGGFINVVEVNRALDELGGRTREFRRRLMSKRPELFKYASTDEKARWLAGMITGPANPPSKFEPSAEYLRTMDAVRSDFPSWSDAKIHDWIKANRPDLQFGGAVQDLTGAVPKPLSPAEQFAREQVEEAFESSRGEFESNVARKVLASMPISPEYGKTRQERLRNFNEEMDARLREKYKTPEDFKKDYPWADDADINRVFNNFQKITDLTDRDIDAGPKGATAYSTLSIKALKDLWTELHDTQGVEFPKTKAELDINRRLNAKADAIDAELRKRGESIIDRNVEEVLDTIRGKPTPETRRAEAQRRIDRRPVKVVKKKGEAGFLNVGDIAKGAKDLYDRFAARHGTEPREAIDIIRGSLRPGSSISHQGGRDYEGYSVTLEFGDVGRTTPYSSPYGPSMHEKAAKTSRPLRDIKRVMFDAEQFTSREDALDYYKEIRKALDETGRKHVPIEGVKYNEETDRYTYGGKVGFGGIPTYAERIAGLKNEKSLQREFNEATDTYFEALDANDTRLMDKYQKRIELIEAQQAKVKAEAEKEAKLELIRKGRGSIDAPAEIVEKEGGGLSARRPKVGPIKEFLKGEKGEWDIEQSKELVQRAGKELHRAYNALASHQARRLGFNVVNDDAAKNYFVQLFRFAEKHNPNLIEDVAKAERAYSEGKFDAAHLHSEKALNGTHDFANQLNLAAGGLHLAEKGVYLNSYNTNWIDTLKEVRRRMGEVGGEASKSFFKDETGSLDLRRYPKGGRPNTTKLAWIFEPAVEKLWISANQRVQQGKLKAKDLREYVKNEFVALLDKEFSDMHLVNRRAVITLGTRRLSQIAGPVVAEKVSPEASYESRRADWQKNVSLWKSYNDMPTEQLIALAQQKFPESYRTNPEAAVDRLFHQIMPKVKKKSAETWHEEVMNRLNAQETALDKEAAKMATELPSHAEQANILAGREVVPPKAPPPADEPELTGGKKVRRYWETLEKTGREAGTEAGYDPEKMADWKRDAEKLISDFGIEGAERFYENAKPSGVRTAVGHALGDYYQIEAARTGNKELLAKSVELANERVTGMTEQGRAIKAADLANKFTLSGAMDEATKLWRQATNKPAASLPDDIAAEVNAKAVARDKAQKKVDKLKATVESEPELPKAEVRKPKIIKGGGKPKITDDPGQAGSVMLRSGKPPEVIAAEMRKKEAAKTFRVMEKRVGKYWTKASHPELEAARIELNQATYDLALMFKAMEQRNQGYFRRTWNLTRSLMVSAWPTAARNAQTQVARSGVERLTDAAELLIRKSVGLDSDLVMKDVWKNYVRQFDPSAKRFSEQILRAHPDELLRIYATYSGGVDIPIPNKMARGVEKLFGKAEAFSYHMNVFNRIQEFHVRSAEFLAELEIHTKKETGMKLEEFVARYGADKLPQPLIKRAVDKALEVTFAANPPRDTNMGRNLNLLIDLGNRLPPTMSPAAFPRFMYNNLKFLYQYNPLGGLANIAYQTKRGGNVPRAIAQQLIGTSMTLLAYQIRNDPELAGGKWYELKTPLGTFDTRPFGPFSTYLLFAEAARRYMKGERGLTGKEWVEGLGASTAPGGLSIATAERLWNYWEQGDWDKAMFMAKTELGDVGRAVFTPIRQLKDIIAQFDPEERKTRDTRNAPVVGPIAESIPYASRAMGLPEARRQTTARPIQQEAPLLKFLTGYRKVAPKTFIESELDRLHFRPQEIRRWTGVRELDSEVTRNMGTYLDAKSEELRNDPQYQQASDAKKFVIMRKVLAGARKASLGQAARQQPEAFKQYKSREPYWKKQLKQDSAP